MPPALAWMDWGSLQGVIVWWLAFAVGFVVGGFVVGLIVQGLVALFSGKKVPLVALWLVRILGGIVCGWLLALILSGRGLGGFGGSGGLWGSSGNGQSNGPAQQTGPPQDNKTPPAPNKETPPTDTTPPGPAKPTAVLDVEVLPLAMTGPPQKPDKGANTDRYYRVSSERANGGVKDRVNGVLMDLAEISERIKGQTDPPVKVVNVILYKDSPAQGSARPRCAEYRSAGHAQCSRREI